MAIASSAVLEIHIKFPLSPRYVPSVGSQMVWGKRNAVLVGSIWKDTQMDVPALPLLAIWFGESQLTSPPGLLSEKLRQ